MIKETQAEIYSLIMNYNQAITDVEIESDRKKLLEEEFLRKFEKIKNEVILSFTRGEDNIAGNITEELKSKGLDPIRKNNIHPATLKKFVKDCLEKNIQINLDTFGAFIQNVAKIGRT